MKTSKLVLNIGATESNEANFKIAYQKALGEINIRIQ